MLDANYTGRIIILRHAQTVSQTGAQKLAQTVAQPGTHKSRAIGHSHVPLSPDGMAHAERFGQLMQQAMNAQDHIQLYSSPSQRALESFGPVYRHSPEQISIIPEFQEIFLGDWEGMAFADIKAQWPNLYQERGAHMATFRPPHGHAQGENFHDVQSRMLKAVQNLADTMAAHKEPHSTALVISHSGAIRTLLCHFLAIPLDNIMDLKIPNLHGIVLDCHDAKLHLTQSSISYMDIPSYITNT